MSNQPTIVATPSYNAGVAEAYDHLEGTYVCNPPEGTDNSDSMAEQRIAFYIPTGFESVVTAELCVDDWGTLKIIDQKTKVVKLTIDMEESAENPPGPRGGHVEWTKSDSVRLTAGEYQLVITHTNVTYQGQYADKKPYNAAKCVFSLDAPKTPVELRPVKITVFGSVIDHYHSAKTFPVEDGKYYQVPVYGMSVEGADADGNPLSDDFSVIRFMPGYNPSSNLDDRYGERNTVGMVGLADAQSHVITQYKPEYELHGAEAPSDNGALVVTGTHYLHDGPDNDEEVFGAYGCLEVFGTRGFSDLKETIKEFAGGYSDVDTESFISTLCSKSKLRIELKSTTRPSLIVDED